MEFIPDSFVSDELTFENSFFSGKKRF